MSEGFLDITYSKSKSILRVFVAMQITIDIILIFSGSFIESLLETEKNDAASKAIAKLLLTIHPKTLLRVIGTTSVIIIQLGVLIFQIVLMLDILRNFEFRVCCYLMDTLQIPRKASNRLLYFGCLLSVVLIKTNLALFINLVGCYQTEETVLDNKYVVVDLMSGNTERETLIVSNKMLVYPSITCYSITYFVFGLLAILNAILGLIAAYFLTIIQRIDFTNQIPSNPRKLYRFINNCLLLTCILFSNYGYLAIEKLKSVDAMSVMIIVYLWLNYGITMTMKADLSDEFNKFEKIRAFTTLIIGSILLSGNLIYIFETTHNSSEHIVMELLLYSGLIRIHKIVITKTSSINELISQKGSFSPDQIIELNYRLNILLSSVVDRDSSESLTKLWRLEVNFWHVVIDQHKKYCKKRCEFCQNKNEQFFTRNEINPLNPEFISTVVFFIEHLMLTSLKLRTKILPNNLLAAILNFKLDITSNFVSTSSLLYNRRYKHTSLLSWMELFLFKRKMQRKISYYQLEGKADRPTSITRQPKINTQNYKYNVILEFHSSIKSIPDEFTKCHTKLIKIFEELLNNSRTDVILKQAESLLYDKIDLEKKLIMTQRLCQGKHAPILNMLCYFYKNIEYSTEKFKIWLKEYLKAQKNTNFSYVISKLSFHDMIVVIVGLGEFDYHKIKSVDGESHSLIGFHHTELVDQDLSIILPNFLHEKHHKYISMRSMYGSILEKKRGVYAFTKTAEDLIILLKVTKRIHFTIESGCMLMGVLEQIPGETTSIDTFYLIVGEDGEILDLNKVASSCMRKGKNMADYNSIFKTVFHSLSKAMHTVFDDLRPNEITSDSELLNCWRILIEFQKGIDIGIVTKLTNCETGFFVQIQDFIYSRNTEYVWIVSMSQARSVMTEIKEIPRNYHRYHQRNYLESQIISMMTSFSSTLNLQPINEILNLDVFSKNNTFYQESNIESISDIPEETIKHTLSYNKQSTNMSLSESPASCHRLASIYRRLSTSKFSKSLKVAFFVNMFIFASIVVLSLKCNQTANKGIKEIDTQITTIDLASLSITGHQMVTMIIDVFRAEKEGWMGKNYTSDFGLFSNLSSFYIENIFSKIHNILLSSELKFDQRMLELSFKEYIDINGWVHGTSDIELPKLDFENNEVVIKWEPKTFSRRAASTYLNEKLDKWIQITLINNESTSYLGNDRNRDTDTLEEILRRNLQGDLNKYYYGYVFQLYEYMKNVSQIPSIYLLIRVAGFCLLCIVSTIIMYSALCFNLRLFRDIYENCLMNKVY